MLVIIHLVILFWILLNVCFLLYVCETNKWTELKNYLITHVTMTPLYRDAPKMYLTLTLNFKAVTTLMSGIFVFSVFPDLYNSFNSLLTLFNGLKSKWHQDIFYACFFPKTGLLISFSHKISANMLLSSSFWYSSGWSCGTLYLATPFTFT